MPRQPFVLNGASYDLAHLEPFVLHVQPKAAGAPSYGVLVTFGCHAFTEKAEADHPPERKYIEGTEERSFCAIRHGHSVELPRIIRFAAAGRVFFSEGRNMLCVEWLPGTNGPYAVFFNLQRWRGPGLQVALNVESAYVKEGLPDRLPATTFATLVATVAKGGRITVPRDLRSIKK